MSSPASISRAGAATPAGALSALCGCPVKVVNDANAAALGEMWLGGGKGYSNVVFVTLGTGVGGGIIVDSKLLTGVHGSGGEIRPHQGQSRRDCGLRLRQKGLPGAVHLCHRGGSGGPAAAGRL